MDFDPVSYIRTRSKEEWHELASGYFSRTRAWIQVNGEKAAIAALVTGIVLVVFYKLVLALGAVAIIVVCLIWNIARHKSEIAQLEAESASAPKKDPPQS